MLHKVKATVIDKKVYSDLQAKYCADPNVGACSCYNIGDEFIFDRYSGQDHFWHCGLNTLVKSDGDPKTTAGGPCKPFCSEAWDAFARYIYAGLQGGSIMHGWMNDDRIMITACSDGTRPVIFKLERLDYKAVYLDNLSDEDKDKLKKALCELEEVNDVEFKEEFMEVYLAKNIEDKVLINIVNKNNSKVIRIDS